MDVIMTLHVRAKMLCNVWSYDFYDMTLGQHFFINWFTGIFFEILGRGGGEKKK